MTPNPYIDDLFKKEIVFKDGEEATYTISIHGVIILSLPGERPRNIGFLAKARGEEHLEYHVVRDMNVHLFRKANAYGINHKIMEMFDPTTIIMYVVDSGRNITTYSLSKATYTEHAKFMHFKKKNFELQRFIEVKYLQLMRSNVREYVPKVHNLNPHLDIV